MLPPRHSILLNILMDSLPSLQVLNKGKITHLPVLSLHTHDFVSNPFFLIFMSIFLLCTSFWNIFFHGCVIYHDMSHHKSFLKHSSKWINAQIKCFPSIYSTAHFTIFLLLLIIFSLTNCATVNISVHTTFYFFIFLG